QVVGRSVDNRPARAELDWRLTPHQPNCTGGPGRPGSCDGRCGVRPFEQLTRQGQLRRLRSAALEALSRYGVEVRRCALVAHSLDTVFRVDDTSGARHALRVTGPISTNRPGVERAAAAWLDALADETR